MTSEESLYLGDWLRIAERDWSRAERLLETLDPELAGFCLQQAVEKFLKAFLLSRGWELLRIHDLEAPILWRVEKLVAGYAPQKVVLFGSYAYGNPGPDSDIDLLIIKETGERFIDRWVEVQRILTGTHRSVPVDTLVLTPEEIELRLAIGDQFVQEILDKGEVLHVG